MQLLHGQKKILQRAVNFKVVFCHVLTDMVTMIGDNYKTGLVCLCSWFVANCKAGILSIR